MTLMVPQPRSAQAAAARVLIIAHQHTHAVPIGAEGKLPLPAHSCRQSCACSVGVLVQENKELTNRLIDLALQNEDDIFDAAFGDSDDEQAAAEKPKRRPSRSKEDAPPVDTAQVQRRQQELAEQVR